MPRQAPPTPIAGTVPQTTLLACRVLLGIALLIDGYLAWVSSSGGALAGCGIESNCHSVLNSRWAYWLGLPVSAPGLLLYAVVLITTFWLDHSTPAAQQRKAWSILVPATLAIMGAALWFIGLQLFVIKAICPYCMTAHSCALLAGGLLLIKAPIGAAPGKARDVERQVFVTRGTFAKLGLSAAGALVVLVIGQMLYRPQTYVSSPIVAGVKTNALVPAARELELFAGQIKFNLREVPLIGRPEAPHTIVSLFDYTCHHCRELHGPLLEAFHAFSNQLAIVSLPMPLDGKCNPVMRRTPPAHVNACAMARLGLTVWQADRTASPKFDEWVFTPSEPPSPEAAEKFARQLVGPEKFDQARTNAWVEEQLRKDIAVFQASYKQTGKGLMPQVILGTNILSGTFGKDALFRMLETQLGLKKPAQ